MASEMLNEVLKAEKAAAKTEHSARIQAEAIIYEAKMNAELIISESNVKSREKAEMHLTTARKQADEIIASAVAEALINGESIKTSAKQKQGDAVKAVKKYILP